VLNVRPEGSVLAGEGLRQRQPSQLGFTSGAASSCDN
jgi:hypothetical protein